jgi:GMP synthase-like glutamine amidotransferase
MDESRRWLVVQHVAHEGPGLVGAALDKAGQRWSVCRVDCGEELPAPSEITELAGLVVLGGPMGVHDETTHRWLEPERRALAAAVGAGLVVLGVCLGAQQLALALGATVWTGDAAEIGLGAVTLTTAGDDDPVLGPAGSPLPCVHWHADTFSLPDGARLLARSDRYDHQGFCVGDRAYGLQFHVEVDAALAGGWAPHLPSGVQLDPRRLGQAEAVGRPMLDRLVALAP